MLGYIGPGARTVGDVVEGILVGGDADEYDALSALLAPHRERDRGRGAPAGRRRVRPARRRTTST